VANLSTRHLLSGGESLCILDLPLVEQLATKQWSEKEDTSRVIDSGLSAQKAEPGRIVMLQAVL
jgi:hypothetical protein